MEEKNEEIERMLVENGLEGSYFFSNPSYETAIIGYTDDGRIVYNYNLMVEYIAKEYECDSLEAMDYIDSNIRWMPADKAPIIVYDFL